MSRRKNLNKNSLILEGPKKNGSKLQVWKQKIREKNP